MSLSHVSVMREDHEPEETLNLGKEGVNISLYDRDFRLWAREQARLLRAGRLVELDADNLAEEIETLVREELRALRRYARDSLVAMATVKFAPGSPATALAAAHLEASGQEARALLRESPSLIEELAAVLAQAWPTARSVALMELETQGLAVELPEALPFGSDIWGDSDEIFNESL